MSLFSIGQQFNNSSNQQSLNLTVQTPEQSFVRDLVFNTEFKKENQQEQLNESDDDGFGNFEDFPSTQVT